ncbi:MAG: hypothetical protein H6658_18000 [Ardenticatenaceae bacterium]|nr:hypothetical protein [Ardenticatenaceae bacterium]
MNLKCSPHILWLQDADQILLTHTQDQRSWILRAEKAFIWDVLCQHHHTALLLEMFSRIYPEHDAQSYFHDVVSEWHTAGILIT